MKKISILCLIMLTCLVAAPVVAKVRASLDKNSISYGEVVRLTVGMEDEHLADQIVTSVLQQDFDILSRNVRSSISIINSVRLTETTLVLVLRPKHTGEIPIPALKVGQLSTEPLMLTVYEKSAVAEPVVEIPPVLIEAEWMNTGESYVQSQLNLLVRIYYVGNLHRAALGEPQMENTLVRRLGEDVHGVKNKNGVEYRTLERHFALFPQKSGALTLPAISMQMRAPVPQNKALQRYGFDVFNKQTIMLSTAPLTIKVLPRPALDQSKSWLPAEEITLTQSGLPTDEIKVGGVINLEFELRAIGLNAEQLPEVSVPGLDDKYSIYPGEPTLRNTTDGRAIKGSRKQTFVLIPKQAGELTIPEIRLAWWDKIKDEQKTIVLPAAKLTIKALLSDKQSADQEFDSAAPLSPEPVPLNQAEDIAQSGTTQFWQWMAAAGLAGWLLTLGYFLLYKPRYQRQLANPAAPDQVDNKPHLDDVLAALSTQNAKNLWRSLQVYGQARWPMAPPKSPQSWAEKLGDDALTPIFADLEASLFSDNSDKAWRGTAFKQSVMPLLKKADKSRKQGARAPSAQLIPALYPD